MTGDPPELPKVCDGDLSWPLTRAAELHGDCEGVIDGTHVVTYAELQRRVASLGTALDELGLAPGARVGFIGLNSLAHLECWLAVPAAGRVLVDLNFRLSLTELEFIVRDAGIELLISDTFALESALALRERCPGIRELVIDGATDLGTGCLEYAQLLAREPRARAAQRREALAGICYTGGTTGSPKGVMLSHGNLLANATHNLLATGHGPGDRWLHVPPMFHVAGTANVFACTWVGARQTILPRFEARALTEIVRQQELTHVVLVPTMLHSLIEELERQGRDNLPSLRHIQYAASPITPALQRRVLEYFNCEVVQFYGMTEAAPTVTRLGDAEHRLALRGDPRDALRLGSIGVPVLGVQTSVRGPAGEPLAAGEVGELWVRGPNVMLGYWQREQQSAAALAGGWYHTGDAARRDQDGYLYIVDRLKDMIISGGENVYSIEVEAALASHPGVSEAAVFGIPDPHWGEAVHAVVSVTPGVTLTTQSLLAHCRGLIAAYKVPRSIELRDEPLPKSGPGKIMKAALREPFWSGHGRRVN